MRKDDFSRVAGNRSEASARAAPKLRIETSQQPKTAAQTKPSSMANWPVCRAFPMNG